MATLQATVGTSLRHQVEQARAESDRLFSTLTSEALYDRPILERHRVIFYVGHLDGFDSIQICREGLGLPSPDAHLDALFQAGIDPDSAHLPTDQPSDWPTLDQVRNYVDACRRHVDAHLNEAPEDTVYMALEHRQMHLETLAYMFHNFDYSRKIVEFQDSIETSGRTPENSWRTIPAGVATLGRNEGSGFGWDNEYQQQKLNVPAFQMTRYSITNGEYLKFVDSGASMPHFWVKQGDSYLLRGMFSEFPLPLDWPVYVTQQQAAAYAKWIGARLPSEPEFHRAAYGRPDGGENAFPWGSEAPSQNFGNFDSERWDPEPVNARPAGDSAFGVSQLVGNGWQWTLTPFAPFPGFQPRSTYPGYSANFFDGEHIVMKGGSPRTAARLLRASFRNWFRADYPYTYATFHCVKD